MVEWQAIVLAIIGSLGLERVILYLFELRARRRQANAAADQVLAEANKTEAEGGLIRAEAEGKSLDSAFKMIDALTKQLANQETRLTDHGKRVSHLMRLVAQYARRLEYLMSGIRILFLQMERACIEPEWKPVEFVVDGEDAAYDHW